MSTTTIDATQQTGENTDTVTPPAGTGAEATNTTEANSTTVQVNEFGYPDNTPYTAMSAEHQAAYWKRNSRKHEDALKNTVTAEEAQQLRDQITALQAKTQTADEQALNASLDAAREEGRKAEREAILPMLHDAQLRGYASTVIEGPKLDAWVKTINPALFLSEDGSVNGEQVVSTLEALFGEKQADATNSAQNQRYMNFGQGAGNPGTPKVNHQEAGLAEARRRGFIA